jgi:menaquinone-dependent protoporphyrinogen oxidase
MPNIFVTYASEHGSTAGIARTIATVLRENMLDVELKRMEEAPENLCDFDAVILGSAVYIGEWLPKAVDFLLKHHEKLAECPTWVFSSGPTGDETHDELADGDILPPDLRPLIDKLNPRDVKVFSGKIDLRRLTQQERVLVKKKGIAKGDYRDWQVIRTWAQDIATTLKETAEVRGEQTELSAE